MKKFILLLAGLLVLSPALHARVHAHADDGHACPLSHPGTPAPDAPSGNVHPLRVPLASLPELQTRPFGAAVPPAPSRAPPL